MGETLVPGVTEEDLRLAAVQAALDAVNEAPPLGPREFTRSDFVAGLETRDSQRGPDWARRALEQLVKRGKLGVAERWDPRTGRRCWGYWWLEGEG